MKIELKKFGVTLTSRQLGKEASAAFKPSLTQIDKDETVEIIFDGVNTLSPSWADEFLTPLHKEYGNKLFLGHSTNPSILATIKLLEDIGQIEYQVIK
ncbi:MAG: hypothetical protein UT02_C0039G0004 [Parcubacteria group bacterium GW2011_GWC2_38_7]|nr:MAG: hypothetical protein UT02_C0039G0004 [Parcubacteria group bacterium GW2011_GWC2_38_7]